MQKSSKKSSKPLPFQASEIRPSGKKEKFVKIPFGFGLKLLLDGRSFRLICLGLWLYIYAAWTANDWLYLLVGGFFVAVILGILLPFLQVVAVHAQCSIPEEIVTDEWADLKIKLDRKPLLGPLSKLMPLRNMRLETNLIRRTPDNKENEYILSPQIFLIKSLTEESWLALPTPTLARGVYFLDKVKLLSCFPFGLAWWSRDFSITTTGVTKQPQLTVRPLALPISGNFLLHLPGQQSTMGLSNMSSIIVPQSTSFRSVREFKPGDSIRHVHWPTSAKQGKIFVREFDSEQLPVFDLLLDLRANWRTKEQFELAVCLIYSLIHLGYRLGIMPDFRTNPPLKSKVVIKHLTYDLPQIPSGLDLFAEILARMEPISSEMAKDPDALSDAITDEVPQNRRERGNRPVLTILPRQELVARYSKERGDHALAPIELALIVPNQSLATTVSKVASSTRKKSASNAKESLTRLKAQQSFTQLPDLSVIATVHTADDFISL